MKINPGFTPKSGPGAVAVAAGKFPASGSRHATTRARLFGRRKISDARKEMFLSEFHSLLASGIDFNRAFELLIDGEKDAAMKKMQERMHRDVVRGDALWQAFALNGNFATLDYGVIRIGEETGRLNESLSFLREYYRKKMAQRRMVSSAVSYPLVILCTAVVVVIFMMTVIVPMFEQVYARMGGELPGITRAVIRLSRSMGSIATASVFLLAGTSALLYFYRNKPAVKRMKCEILLRTPVVGGLLRRHYQSHFCKLMYLLYSSGIPLLQGVNLLRDIITFYPYRLSFDEIARGLNNGESFAAKMGGFPHIYDRKLVTLLRVGEETNRLADMLQYQGEELSSELEHSLKQLGSMLEPLLIFLVGVLVAVILISMYLPMFKLGNNFL